MTDPLFANAPVGILQRHSSFQHRPFFGKSKGLANQTAVVQPGGEVVAFDTEGRDVPTFSISFQPLPDLVWISPGDFFLDAQEPTVGIPLLDGTHKDHVFIGFDPGVFPFGSAMHRLFYLFPKHGKHRRGNGEIPVRGKKRIALTGIERIIGFGHPFLNLVEQTFGACFIVLAHKRSHTHLRVPLYAAPHVAVSGFFGIVLLLEVLLFFFTNVHNASSWASLRWQFTVR